MAALQQATSTVPIVFVQVSDAVGAGFAESMSRPGGNATGFEMFPEYGVSAKWLELLKQFAARMTRAGVLRDPSNPSAIGLMAAMQSVAPALGVELSPLGVRDAAEIERSITAFAQRPNGGMILIPATPGVIWAGIPVGVARLGQYADPEPLGSVLLWAGAELFPCYRWLATGLCPAQPSGGTWFERRQPPITGRKAWNQPPPARVDVLGTTPCVPSGPRCPPHADRHRTARLT
jgi:hypothetical protein